MTPSLLTRRAACGLAAVACAAPLLPRAARAQGYPTRAVKILVPFPAGGAQDLLARTLSDGLAERLKQPVLVENRPGAAGNLGADALAKSAPDGHTLGVLSGVHTANAAFYRKLPFDLEKDFALVRPLGDSAVLIVTSPRAPFRTVPELLQHAKSRPGTVLFGSTTSLTMDLLKVDTGLDVTMVPYKGLGEALQDLMGDRIHLAAGPSTQLVPLVRDGKLRVVGIASGRRIAELPGVPTVAETVPGYDAGMWYGLFAPTGTPKPVLDRLQTDVSAVMATPAVLAKLAVQGIDPAFGSASATQVAARMQQEIARWRRVAATTGNYAN